MAFEVPSFLPGVFSANLDLSDAQYLPVKPVAASGANVSAPAIGKISSSGEPMLGIIQNGPALAEAATIMVAGISKAVVRGTGLVVGAKLMAVATGLGVCTSGSYQVATLLEDASDGDVASVLIQQNGRAA